LEGFGVALFLDRRLSFELGQLSFGLSSVHVGRWWLDFVELWNYVEHENKTEVIDFTFGLHRNSK
jgi:hypothetical protein